MAGLLTGLLGALGGPQNILKSVGGFVGDVIQGVEKGKPIGQTLLGAAGRGLKTLVGIDGEDQTLNNKRTMIVPQDMLGKSRATLDREELYKQQRVLQDQASPGGLPVVRTLRYPEETYTKQQIIRNEARGNKAEKRARLKEELRRELEEELDQKRERRMAENLAGVKKRKKRRGKKKYRREL